MISLFKGDLDILGSHVILSKDSTKSDFVIGQARYEAILKLFLCQK